MDELESTPVEISEPLKYHRHRYFLIKHDPDDRLLAFLYWHSHIIATVGDPASTTAIDIVQTRGQDVAEAEYLANYQYKRFAASGYGRGDGVYETYPSALEMALRATKRLDTL